VGPWAGPRRRNGSAEQRKGRLWWKAALPPTMRAYSQPATTGQRALGGMGIEGTNDPDARCHGDIQEIAGGGRATVTRMGRDPRPEAGRGSVARPMHSRAIGRGPGRHGRGRPRKSERLNSCSGNVSSLRYFGQHTSDRNPSLVDPLLTSVGAGVAVHPLPFHCKNKLQRRGC
jgi:hypothetical protein